MDSEALSGSYSGFYFYGQSSGTGHEMNTTLSFADNGVITGSGSDDIGVFQFKGNWNKASQHIQMTKTYSSHTVAYEGNYSQQSKQVIISGSWVLSGFITLQGSFTLKMSDGKDEVMEDIEELEEMLNDVVKELELIE